MLDEMAEAYDPLVALGAGSLRMAVIGDPVALREMLAMPTGDVRWGHKFNNVLGFVVADGSMIVSDGVDHSRRRSAVQPAFGRRRRNGWIPTIVERTDAAIDRLEAELDGSGRVVDLFAFGRSLVLEIVERAMFGERLAGRAGEIGGLFERPQAHLESPVRRQLSRHAPRWRDGQDLPRG